MLPSESPFPCYWWSFSLENVGLGEARPRVGTYGRYAFDRLPPVPFELRGDFAWLATAPEWGELSIGANMAAENPEALVRLRDAAARLGVRLPEPFLRFLETPGLHDRVRSNTDCFLDLCPELVRSPLGAGYLVRFLTDSQWCLFWYLYLSTDGSDHAVVASPGFYGAAEEGQWDHELPGPAEIVYAADSFEAFIWRFWLENEIWFAGWQKTPMPAGGWEYIEQYRGRGA